MLEGAAWVYIVARIDTHFLTILCGDIGRMSRKMHIGHQGRLIAISLQSGRNVLHILCLTGSLSGKAHQFTASINDTLGLCH